VPEGVNLVFPCQDALGLGPPQLGTVVGVVSLPPALWLCLSTLGFVTLKRSPR